MLARQLSLLGRRACWAGLRRRDRVAGRLSPGSGLAAGSDRRSLLVETGRSRGCIALRDPRLRAPVTAILVRPVHALTYPRAGAAARRASARWAGTSRTRTTTRRTPTRTSRRSSRSASARGSSRKSEGEMVRGIVDLDDTRVREIMTPARGHRVAGRRYLGRRGARGGARGGPLAVPGLRRARSTTIVGILHVRDLLRAWERGLRGRARIAGLRAAGGLRARDPHGRARCCAEMRHARPRRPSSSTSTAGSRAWSRSRTCSRRSSATSATSTSTEEALVAAGQRRLLARLRRSPTSRSSSASSASSFGERDFDTVGGLRHLARWAACPTQGETFCSAGPCGRGGATPIRAASAACASGRWTDADRVQATA